MKVVNSKKWKSCCNFKNNFEAAEILKIISKRVHEKYENMG